MSDPPKKNQYFILSPNHAVETILEFLRTDLAQSLGIERDFSVRILDLNDKGTKHIPIQIKNLHSLDKDLQILQKEVQIKVKVTSLPWNELWSSRRNADLHENLLPLIPLEILEYIPTTFDTIGNLAIIEIDRWGELSKQIDNNFEFQRILSLVGEVITKLHKNITTVIRKLGNIEGEFRLRNYEVISGPPQTSTLHKENHCYFYVDPRKMFFSPRLSFERNRVSKLEYENNSIIIDCFSGCGPFSIQIALKHNVHVFGIEKNPDAITYFENNIELNRNQLVGTISTFEGDFREFIDSESAQLCQKNSDYIIMNLPERSYEFIPHIIPFVKEDCTYLIFYCFLKSSYPLQDAEVKLKDLLEENNLSLIEIVQKRIVFSYSPNQNNVGIDAKIKRRI